MEKRLYTIGWCTLVFLTIGAIGQIVYFLPLLPEKVASHFDAQGNPNSTMHKTTFATLMVVINVFVGVLFLALPWLIKISPPSMVNMPNRDYWLQGDRRDEAIRTLAGFCFWIGIVTLLLMMITYQLVVIANIRNQNLNSTVFWAAVIGYLIVIAGSCLWLYRRFRIPE